MSSHSVGYRETYHPRIAIVAWDPVPLNLAINDVSPPKRMGPFFTATLLVNNQQYFVVFNHQFRCPCLE